MSSASPAPSEDQNAKVAMKTIRMEIKRLLDRWDPLSLKGLPGFHSEYNDFVGPLSVLVRKRAAPSEIAQHLHRLLTETWKMPADQPGCYKLAEKIHRTGAFLDVPPAQ